MYYIIVIRVNNNRRDDDHVEKENTDCIMMHKKKLAYMIHNDTLCLILIICSRSNPASPLKIIKERQLMST